jgi:hypothetical protein
MTSVPHPQAHLCTTVEKRIGVRIPGGSQIRQLSQAFHFSGFSSVSVGSKASALSQGGQRNRLQQILPKHFQKFPVQAVNEKVVSRKYPGPTFCCCLLIPCVKAL